MYELLKIRDTVRVDPKYLNLPREEAILKSLKENYEGKIDKKLGGLVISIVNIENISEGYILPGDGGVYYDVDFSLLLFKPVLNEVIEGQVVKIIDKGAFVNLGPIDGFVHKSQIMDDYIIFNPNSKAFEGKTSKRVLKEGNIVRARIVSVSFTRIKGREEQYELRIGLTMRQPGLGSLDWFTEEEKKKK